jgi:hypothetical protein
MVAVRYLYCVLTPPATRVTYFLQCAVFRTGALGIYGVCQNAFAWVATVVLHGVAAALPALISSRGATVLGGARLRRL